MKFNHSAHDYNILMQKWQALSMKSCLQLKELTLHNHLPVFEVSNELAKENEKCIYLSAGIHGDEPASCWSILHWVEKNVHLIDCIPIIIFPCLNPWGLLNNSRNDQEGNDLNRVWSDRKHSLIGKIITRIEHLSFSLSLNLHEDFDANGIYLYEPIVDRSHVSWAHKILNSGRKVLPVDSRKIIDERTAKKGIIRPHLNNPLSNGMPEALYLVQTHGKRNFTIETPSEASIDLRVLAQMTMIEEAVRLAS